MSLIHFYFAIYIISLLHFIYSYSFLLRYIYNFTSTFHIFLYSYIHIFINLFFADKYDKWIIVAGGQDANGPTKTTEIYNKEKDYWFPTSDMPTARCAAATVVCGNKFLVIGGMGAQGPCGNVEALVFE